MFALVHGAWHGPWCWELLVPELEARGDQAVTPELPSDDPNAGLVDYVHTVEEALAHAGNDVVLVGHSLAGITVPLVAAARRVRALVLLGALLPEPGKSLFDTLNAGPSPFVPGSDAGRGRDNLGRSFWNDREETIRILYGECGRGQAEAAFERLRPSAAGPQAEPSPLEHWPDVPTHYISGTKDAMVSPDWSRQAAARIGATLHELDSDHSPMLSRPAQLAELLISCA